MKEQSYKARLQQHIHRLTPVEQAISDYIFTQGDKVLQMAITDLAAAAGVAPSGIVRFCKKLGYPGYSQLKLSLAALGLPTDDMIMPAVSPDDDSDAVLDKVFQSGVEALRDTLAMLDRGAFSQAVAWLAESDKIEFYGIGTSATIAADAYYRLMRIGYPAFCATDPMIMRMSAAQLISHQTAIGISHTGQTIDTIEALRLAREKGARTIALTSYRESPICQAADLVLCISSEESRYPIEAVSARIAHIAVLDALCASLAVLQPERTRERIGRMNSLIRGMRAVK